MPNLNYVPQDGTQDGTQKNEEIRIIELMRNDSKISTEKIAEQLGISIRTVKRRIKELNNVKFIGRGSNGHWEIIEKNNGQTPIDIRPN